ncbi:MAG: hypothetical protein ACFFD4_12330 [Candidatus Odinarchaeota archaeon]
MVGDTFSMKIKACYSQRVNLIPLLDLSTIFLVARVPYFLYWQLLNVNRWLLTP